MTEAEYGEMGLQGEEYLEHQKLDGTRKDPSLELSGGGRHC